MIRHANDESNEGVAKEKIYLKNEALFCTGNSELARTNNEAALLIDDGKYTEAIDIIQKELPKASLFFPYRYNLGLAYMHLEKFPIAMMHFEKAQMIVPDYSRTYLQMGYIHVLWNKENTAIDYYREGMKKNKKELNTFILIGDIYYNRNQVEIADKYYTASLNINPRFPNGLLGKAKIHFKREEYYKAIVMLKGINTSGDYDKSYHFFFAESAFKLKDYNTAAIHYEKLMEFRNDRFFITNSPALIKHKLELAKKFIE